MKTKFGCYNVDVQYTNFFLSALNMLVKSSGATKANPGILKLVQNRSMYCGNSIEFFFINS